MPPVTGGEQAPSLPPLETRLEHGQERYEQVAEARAQVGDMAQPVQPLQAPLVAAPPQTPDSPQQAMATPLVAADEDLIEKEWVDKAKEIIEHTKGDPYTRTQKVNELQRDYLQKRYGKVVGANE